MEFLFRDLSEMEVYGWEMFIDDWFFVVAAGFFLLELIRYAFKRQLTVALMGDSVANLVTLGLFLGVSFFLFAGLQIGLFSWASQFALFDIDINWATIAVCIVLADLVYYWEHRVMHRANILWMTHMVHHSSPNFNISVAYRFGPFDGFWPVFFHLPLALLGFNPFVIFFAEMFVQLYQTLLHTEAFGKFPRPVEAVMNTPSHHRVHHGSNPEYLDSNYAGIFIIWDRMFGTFAEEKAKVDYGLVKPVNSLNPFKIFVLGIWNFGKEVGTARSLGALFAAIFLPPGANAEETDDGSSTSQKEAAQ